MMIKKGVVLLILAAASLAFAGTAFASYWFFQGNLPRPDGTRSTFLGSDDNNPPVFIRESWSPCTHNMNIVLVNTDYSWTVKTFQLLNGCDQSFQDLSYPAHINYGCSNPTGDSQVYDNCYVGQNP